MCCRFCVQRVLLHNRQPARWEVGKRGTWPNNHRTSGRSLDPHAARTFRFVLMFCMHYTTFARSPTNELSEPYVLGALRWSRLAWLSFQIKTKRPLTAAIICTLILSSQSRKNVQTVWAKCTSAGAQHRRYTTERTTRTGSGRTAFIPTPH